MSSIEVLASAKSFWRLPLFTQKQIVLWLVFIQEHFQEIYTFDTKRALIPEITSKGW